METFELIPKSKPKSVNYFSGYGGITSTVKSSHTTESDIEETQFILGSMAEQILIYTERMKLTGHEDEEARNAILEVLNLAAELEALRTIDEDDDAVLYD